MNPIKNPFSQDTMQGQSANASKLLKALANPQRLRILCLLIEREMTVGQINEQIELSQSALSQHLAILREKELVTTRKLAQTVFYRVQDGPVTAIIQTLHDLYCPSNASEPQHFGKSRK